jgi:hypothetical protein
MFACPLEYPLSHGGDHHDACGSQQQQVWVIQGHQLIGVMSIICPDVLSPSWDGGARGGGALVVFPLAGSRDKMVVAGGGAGLGGALACGRGRGTGSGVPGGGEAGAAGAGPDGASGLACV